MASCLGLYIEPNIIKYAKVSKERDALKIEAFGIKFYDRLGDAIKQIISDTVSFKTPISINLSEETYNYFYMFSLLNKNDLKKAIATEFESMCADKNINKNAVETRYALANSIKDKEKIKVIHVASNKNAITALEQQLGEYHASTITPIGVSIANVANLKEKENAVIINIEDKTTITTVVDQKIYNVETIEEGAKTVLDSINAKENSYSKAYEICKNSTIYTMEGKELQDVENEYLDDIMPTLYKIASKVQETLTNDTIKIDRIYITGTLSVVNNIDLYFQEFFNTEKCEVMKPYFLKDNIKINIKDYIEVNSAIALALQGLGYGLKDMNFKKKEWKDDLGSIFSKSDASSEKKGKSGILGKQIDLSQIFRFNLNEKLDNAERWMIRVTGGILALTIIYSAFSLFLNYAINRKNEEVSNVKMDTESQIILVSSDITQINQKTNRYQELSENLKNISEEIQAKNKNKKAIPNLLSQIMFAIPQGVQITSIENTNSNHIVINAQSEKYEQLGIFKAILKTQKILDPDTIVSSSGTKQGNVVQIVIEGDLP